MKSLQSLHLIPRQHPHAVFALLSGLAFTSILACSSEGDDAEKDAISDLGGAGGEDGHDHEHEHTGGASAGGSQAGGENAGGENSGLTDFCVEHHDACDLVECEHFLAEGLHVTECSALSPTTNPPSSGPHYPVWAAFEKYDDPVPQGYWIHSMEHSGVILTYNCDQAEAAGVNCTELVQELSDFFDAWPEDPLCSASRHRLLLTPDPLLDSAFAASAWGHTIKGDCLNAELVSAFIDAHYGKNYENICAAGIDPTSAPDDCGK